ncbi:MAG: hypothetical protein U9N18_06960 [Campylobacterota bacterium]|nr:hypothetical protein [Campylobacterota bacterium]
MVSDLEKVLKTDELVRQKVEPTKQEAAKILQNARKTARKRHGTGYRIFQGACFSNYIVL